MRFLVSSKEGTTDLSRSSQLKQSSQAEGIPERKRNSYSAERQALKSSGHTPKPNPPPVVHENPRGAG